MGLSSDLAGTFGQHALSRIFLVNLFEHCSIGHLPIRVVSTTLSAAATASGFDFDLFDPSAEESFRKARSLVNRFRDIADAEPRLAAGLINPDPLSHCSFIQVHKRSSFEAYMRAPLLAARSPGYSPAVFSATDIRTNWFTQEHDVIMRDGLTRRTTEISPFELVSRLGLIHFWGRPEEVCMIRLSSSLLATMAKRPTAINGGANPAYLAVSQGEHFSRSLSELATDCAPASAPDLARTLELSGVEDRQLLIDGAIEVIIDLANSQIAEHIEGDLVIVGPLDVPEARSGQLLTMIDWLRCPDEKMSTIYKSFEDALSTS